MNNFSIQKTPKNIAKEIAAKFKKLRKQTKLSRKELAERSGVSESSIKRFETTGQIAFVSLLKVSQTIERIDDFGTIFLINDSESVIDLFSDKMKL
ncbi:MAG: transcriptional regulator [Lutibacter sp.]|nr:MAG: transcriptional regulator [Lutibacter sp.]